MQTFGKVDKSVTYVERPGAYGIFLDSRGEMAIVRTTMGLFLPGGGADPGEVLEQTLAREILEEIGHQVLKAKFYAEAAQYHWSTFYKQHFKKVGAFYRVEASPVPGMLPQSEHELLWMPKAEAARRLSQEFQRWAVLEAK